MVRLPASPAIRRAVLLAATSVAARGAAESAHDAAVGVRGLRSESSTVGSAVTRSPPAANGNDPNDGGDGSSDAKLCVRRYKGPGEQFLPGWQYWFPTDDGAGGQKCSHNPDPAEMHMTDDLCATQLLGTEDVCCENYPHACKRSAGAGAGAGAVAGGNNHNGNGNGNNHNGSNNNGHKGGGNGHNGANGNNANHNGGNGNKNNDHNGGNGNGIVHAAGGEDPKLCVRRFAGPGSQHVPDWQYWYPTDDGAGGKTCTNDPDPSDIHMTNDLCATLLFGTEEECCENYPHACGHSAGAGTVAGGNGATQVNAGNNNGGNNHNGNGNSNGNGNGNNHNHNGNNADHTSFCQTDNLNPNCPTPNGEIRESVWVRVACTAPAQTVDCSAFCFEKSSDCRISDFSDSGFLADCGIGTAVGDRCRGRNGGHDHNGGGNGTNNNHANAGNHNGNNHNGNNHNGNGNANNNVHHNGQNNGGNGNGNNHQGGNGNHSNDGGGSTGVGAAATAPTTMCIRGHNGNAWLWTYPTNDGSGVKKCASDADPSKYHMTDNLCATGLFGKEDECCKAYPDACGNPDNKVHHIGGGNNHKGANGNNANNNSHPEVAVCFRGYDGHSFVYSYPIDDGLGGKMCPDHVDPTDYHATDDLCDTGLFGTVDECCKAYPKGCGRDHPTNNVNHNGGGNNHNGANGNKANHKEGNGNKNAGNAGANNQVEDQVGALSEPQYADASKESRRSNGLIYFLLLVGGASVGLTAGFLLHKRKDKAPAGKEAELTEGKDTPWIEDSLSLEEIDLDANEEAIPKPGIV